MSLLTGFHLLMGGAWIALPDVDAEFPVNVGRPSSTSTSLGGVVRTQQARRQARTWQFSLPNGDAETVRWLGLAASGLAGDVYLYDVAAFQANGLDPLNTVGSDPTQPLIDVDGVGLRAFTEDEGFTSRIRPGTEYHLSGWTVMDAGDVIGVATYDDGTVTAIAPPGVGSRQWSASFMSLVATTVTTVWSTAGVTSGAMLTEGSLSPAGFLPGEKGVCQVSVGDPQMTRVEAFEDRLTWTDYTVTVQEVGR